MSGHDITGAPGAEQEMQAIKAQIGHARARLGAGELIDLSALDGRVVHLCARLEALRAEEGAALRAEVMGLIDELSLLARLIEARLEALRKKLHQDGDEMQAAAPGGAAPPKKPAP